MEDGLWAQVEAAERAAAAAGYLDLEEEEAQRQKRMAELHKIDNSWFIKLDVGTKPSQSWRRRNTTVGA